MRVTMFVRCLAMMRGGGETRHLAWMRELSALGVDVDVIAGQPLLLGHAKHPVTEARAAVVRTPYLRDAVYRWQHTRGFGRATMTAQHLDDEWFCRAAWREIASRPAPPDLIHAHALHQAARLRHAGIPVVINLPGAPHPRYHEDLCAADALIADGWAAEHLPGVLGRDVTHVPKGVDAMLFSPDGSTRRQSLGLHDKRVVLAVGRLVPIKNISLLIDALAHVRQRIPSAHLVIAGEGPERGALESTVVRAGLRDAVTFLGYVPLTELPSVYRTADVLGLPSKFDNSPNVVLEAMAAGLPVVAADVGGVGGFVEQGVGGTLVAGNEARAMADALVTWLESADRRLAARAHNRRVVLERYSWRASARRLLDVYERILSRRGSGELDFAAGRARIARRPA